MAITTWAQALLDERVPIRWLLVLSTPAGVVARLADVEAEVDGVVYHTGLAVDTPPGVSVDVFSSRGSSTTARVSIAAVVEDYTATGTEHRPYDLDEIHRASFTGMRAQLYRWAEGTTDPHLELDGYVDAPRLSESGRLTLDLTSRMTRFDRRLPRYRLDAVYNANVYADDAGQGFPIMYGTFVRVECPIYDTATGNDLAALSEGTVTLSDLQRNDASTTGESAAQATDDRGFTYTYVTDDSALGDDDITASGAGLLDDSDGTYTGTADALITHPADQIHHLARTFCGWSAARVDAGSFIALRTELPGWVGAVQVHAGDDTTFSAVCEDTCLLLRAAVYEEAGKLTARRLDFTRAPALAITEGINLRGIDGIEWAGQRDRPTKIKVKYNWSWRRKRKMMDFLASQELNETNYAPFAENYAANEQETVELPEIETKMIADAATVSSALSSLAELHGVQRKLVRVRVNREAHAVRLLDVVTLTCTVAPSAGGTGWTAKRFVVVGIPRSGLDEDTLTLLEN